MSLVGALANVMSGRRGGVFDASLTIEKFRVGHLKSFQEQWRELGGPEHLLKIVGGYAISFGEKPPLVQFNKSSLNRFDGRGDHKGDTGKFCVFINIILDPEA